MEHIEEAGVHSGDSACSLPPYSLTPETIAELERQTEALALALERPRPDERPVRHQGRRHLRARGQPARLAHRALRRQDHRHADRQDRAPRSWPASRSPSFGLKPADARPRRGQGSGVPVRPLPRRRHRARPGDALDRRGHGPRPRLRRAFAKSQLGAGIVAADRRARCSSRSRTATSRAIVRAGARPGRARLQDPRHRRHRSASSRPTGVPCAQVNKVLEGRPHIVDAMKNGEVQLVFNTTEGAQALADSFAPPHRADAEDPLLHDHRRARSPRRRRSRRCRTGDLEVRPLQSYFAAAA